MTVTALEHAKTGGPKTRTGRWLYIAAGTAAALFDLTVVLGSW